MEGVVDKIFKMESSSVPANNIPVKGEISCLPANDIESKKQLLEETDTENKICHFIGAKSKVIEEIDSMEKTDRKQRKSSEKRVRFSDVIHVYGEPASLFRTLEDDGNEDFSSLVTVPLRSIIASRQSGENAGDCINVNDFQERYNHLNKGTGIWQRRKRERFSKKSFGDFIGSQDFTAPLATMEEMDCFSDESPDAVFKDFEERDDDEEEKESLLPENALLTREECAREDSGDEDRTVRTRMAEDDTLEDLMHEACIPDTSAFHPLDPEELLLRDLGSAGHVADATESGSFLKGRTEAPVVGVGVHGRCSPEASDELTSSSTTAAAVTLESDSTDEATGSHQHIWTAECDAISDHHTEFEKTDTLGWNIRGTDGSLATSTALIDLPAELSMVTRKVTAPNKPLAKNGEPELDEFLATNEIMKLVEIKTMQGSKLASFPDDITTIAGSKVSVPDDILTVVKSNIPMPDDIVMIDEYRSPLPDEINKSTLPEAAVMTGKCTAPGELLEMDSVNVWRTTGEAVTVPDEGYRLPDEEVTISLSDRIPDRVTVAGVTVTGITVPDEGITVPDEGITVPDEGITVPHELFLETAVKVPDGDLFSTGEVLSKQTDKNEVVLLGEDQLAAEAKQTDELLTRNETLERGTVEDNAFGVSGFEQPDNNRLTSSAEFDFEIRTAVEVSKRFSAGDRVHGDTGWLPLPEKAQDGVVVMSSLYSASDGDSRSEENQLFIPYVSGDNSLSGIQLCNYENPIPARSSNSRSSISHSSISDCSDETTFSCSLNSEDSVMRRFTCVLIPNLTWSFHCDRSLPWEVETECSPKLQIKSHTEVRKCGAGVASPRASRVATRAASMRKARPHSGFN